MKQASSAIVLVILIVVIAVVATPLLPGDGSPSAATEGSAGAFRLASPRTSHVATPSRRHTGEWAMLLVGSALVVVGTALRRPASPRTSALRSKSAALRHSHRQVERAAGRPVHARLDSTRERRRLASTRSLPGREP